MTGLRIGEILALKRADVDLENGYLVTRHGDNKGKRDERLKLHPVVVSHLQDLRVSSNLLFPWPHNLRSLRSELARIQREAGIHLHCPESHSHTRASNRTSTQ